MGLSEARSYLPWFVHFGRGGRHESRQGRIRHHSPIDVVLAFHEYTRWRINEIGLVDDWAEHMVRNRSATCRGLRLTSTSQTVSADGGASSSRLPITIMSGRSKILYLALLCKT